ncbi:hypothetical protein GCM10022237_18730 [Nocardioides ginsengisoli]
MVGLVLLCAALFSVTGMTGMTEPTMGGLACWLLVGLAGALVATYDPTAGAGGAPTLYLAVFGMFHAGLIVSYVAIGDSALVGQGDNRFVDPQTLLRPVIAVLTGLLALVVGYLLARHLAPVAPPHDSQPTADRVGVVGLVAVVVGAGIVFRTLGQGGIGLGSGYGDFLEAAATSTYGYGVLLVGYGCSFLVVAGGRYRTLGLVAMGVVGSVLLVLGSRGAVLFPVLAMVYAVGRRRRVRPVSAVIVAVLGLGVTSVIRVTRLGGFRALLAGDGDFSPWHGLAELGYSIYPVVVVQRWMDGGEEPRHGVTLIAVPLRFLARLFGGGAPPAKEDHRLFNVEILDRQGPIGGSPIAEAIRNGGLPFVVVLMAAIGVLLWLAARGQGSRGTLWGVVLLLPLLIGTRNSFAPIPAQWLIGSLLVVLASAGARARDRVPT